MIFQVDAERFSELYKYLVNADKIKRVNWYVDEIFLHCYLTWSSETYYYSIEKDIIPESIKGLLTEKGQILGVVSQPQQVEEEQIIDMEFFTKGGMND